jgi:regulatory protein
MTDVSKKSGGGTSKKQAEKPQKEKPSAFLTAANYLAKGLKTEREVRSKLKARGYPRAEVEDAVKKLKEYRYIDDFEYARTYVSEYGQKFGATLIKQKLSQKGVDASLVQSALSELPEGSETELCRKTAENYIAKRRLQKTDRAKAANYLYSKGFSWDDINEVMSDGGLFDRDDDTSEDNPS